MFLGCSWCIYKNRAAGHVQKKTLHALGTVGPRLTGLRCSAPHVLQSTHTGKPRVAYLIIERSLIHIFCARNLENLFECHGILQFRGPQTPNLLPSQVVLIVGDGDGSHQSERRGPGDQGDHRGDPDQGAALRRREGRLGTRSVGWERCFVVRFKKLGRGRRLMLWESQGLRWNSEFTPCLMCAACSATTTYVNPN